MKKATKIIGAVLGVLLVAALFTGAAAAEVEETTPAGNAAPVALFTITAPASVQVGFPFEVTVAATSTVDAGFTVTLENDPSTADVFEFSPGSVQITAENPSAKTTVTAKKVINDAKIKATAAGAIPVTESVNVTNMTPALVLDGDAVFGASGDVQYVAGWAYLPKGEYTIEGDNKVVKLIEAAFGNTHYLYPTTADKTDPNTFKVEQLTGTNTIKITIGTTGTGDDKVNVNAKVRFIKTPEKVGDATITLTPKSGDSISKTVTVYPNKVYYDVFGARHDSYEPGETIIIAAYNATDAEKTGTVIDDDYVYIPAIQEKVVKDSAGVNTITVPKATVKEGKITPGYTLVKGTVGLVSTDKTRSVKIAEAADGKFIKDRYGDDITITIKKPSTPEVHVLGAGIVVGGMVTAEIGSGPISLGDVEVWRLYGGELLDELTAVSDYLSNAVWTDEAGNKVKFEKDPVYSGFFINGDAIDGTYYHTVQFTNITFAINVKHLDLPVVGYVVKNESPYKAVAGLSGATVDVDNFYIQVPGQVAWINPAGTLVTLDPSQLGITTVDEDKCIFNAKNAYDFGEYTIAAAEKRDAAEGEEQIYSSLAPTYILGDTASFTLKSLKDSTSLTALSDEIIQGGFVTIAVEAPYGTYKVAVKEATIPKGQVDVTPNASQTEALIDVGLSGEAAFVVKSESDEDVKVELYKKGSEIAVDKTVTVKVKAGEIKADATGAATYIGNEVEFSGTNDLPGNLDLFIKGPNFNFTVIPEYAILKNPVGKEWTAKIDTGKLAKADGKKPDAGNYTIYVAKLTGEKAAAGMTAADLDDKKYCEAYTTVVVALKQPFINVTEFPAVVVKGEKLVIKGTAEGQPKNVMYYIFGTNFFTTGTATVNDEGIFEITYPVPKNDDTMQANQYFAVIQHPMYDKTFNVGPVPVIVRYEEGKPIINGYNIKKNESGAFNDPEAIESGKSYTIFNTNDRQSANAAQALCDALDDQNIDDMYVKQSFFVAGPSSVIGAIPEQIVKGEKLTISGVAIGHKNEAVSVDLLSTAFAAVPKETVGSASFTSATARVGEDGLWTITIDTSDLNADEYTVSVAVGQLSPATSKIKIVEGTVPTPTTEPTTQPTAQPTAQPTQTPASPGFGILAALAGLGAVAVLLLRRQ